MKHVIIGAGAAGIAAIKTIRKHNQNDEIVLIVTDERRKESRPSHEGDFLTQNNVRSISGKKITGINIRNRLILFEDGMEYFDNLLIAADNAMPFSKPASNLLDLRHLPDMDAVYRYAQNAENIVIVGAGCSGLDVACTFLDLGKTATIIDGASYLFTKNLEKFAADIYKTKFEEAGCVFEFNSKVVSAEYDDTKVVSITLDSGKTLNCDMVVIAASCCPPVDFLAETDSDIGFENGVDVDEYCSTGVKGVYAAGDVTGQPGFCAGRQGEVAAKNMVGIPVTFDDMPTHTINYFDIPTLSLGQSKPQDGDIIKEREKEGNYERVILRDDVVVGVLMQGCTSHSALWQFLIDKELNVSLLDKPIFDLSVADFHSMDLG